MLMRGGVDVVIWELCKTEKFAALIFFVYGGGKRKVSSSVKRAQKRKVTIWMKLERKCDQGLAGGRG